MNFKNLFRSFLMAVFIAVCVVSCYETDQMDYPETVYLDANGGDTIVCGNITIQNIQITDGNTNGIDKSANTNIINYECDWISIVVNKNDAQPKLHIYYEPNYSLVNRSLKIYGYNGKMYATIKVVQPPVIGNLIH